MEWPKATRTPEFTSSAMKPRGTSSGAIGALEVTELIILHQALRVSGKPIGM
jgi:hypothetical protein